MTELALVPGRVVPNGITWWIFHPTSANFVSAKVSGIGSGQTSTKDFILKSPAGFAIRLLATIGMQADTEYTLTVTLSDGSSQSLSVRTIPTKLEFNQDLTISFGSCYCYGSDQTGKSGPPINPIYPPKQFQGTGNNSIRFRFLCGDQVYLDLEPSNGSPILLQPNTWEYYRKQWMDFRYRKFIAATPNLFLADDHEFWNDYPHSNVWQLWNPGPDTEMERKMLNAFESFQSCLNLEPNTLHAIPPGGFDSCLKTEARNFSFKLNPLEFFMLDTRTQRTRYDISAPHFCVSQRLQQVLAWLKNLGGPGVLILGQPLLESPATWFEQHFHTMGDVNLPDYSDDFATLWDAIFDAPHDILILSGDIHYCRGRLITKGNTGSRKVVEIISSPFQRIPFGAPSLKDIPRSGQVKWSGVNGIANWVDKGQLPINSSPIYATISFRLLSGGGVRANTTWWSASAADQSQAVAVNSVPFEFELN